MDNHKILSVGADPELLWLRHAVLQNAGFDVSTAVNESDALAHIQRGECTVLLVCYSLSRPIRERLAEAFRRHCSGQRIIAITNEQMDKPEFADTFVYGVEGPEALIESVKAA